MVHRPLHCARASGASAINWSQSTTRLEGQSPTTWMARVARNGSIGPLERGSRADPGAVEPGGQGGAGRLTTSAQTLGAGGRRAGA